MSAFDQNTDFYQTDTWGICFVSKPISIEFQLAFIQF